MPAENVVALFENRQLREQVGFNLLEEKLLNRRQNQIVAAENVNTSAFVKLKLHFFCQFKLTVNIFALSNAKI